MAVAGDPGGERGVKRALIEDGSPRRGPPPFGVCDDEISLGCLEYQTRPDLADCAQHSALEGSPRRNVRANGGWLSADGFRDDPLEVFDQVGGEALERFRRLARAAGEDSVAKRRRLHRLRVAQGKRNRKENASRMVT